MEIVSNIQDIKIFLEGIQVPCSTLTLSISAGKPAVISFDVPNTDELTDIAFEPPDFHGLQPDTIVQSFFNDNGTWKQLFDGIVSSMGEFESVSNVACNISAIDMSKFWRKIPQYFLDKSKSGYPPGDYLLGRKNASALKVKGQPVNIESKFMSLLKKNGLLEGLKKILELVEGINAYYESVESRLNIKKRFTIFDNYKATELYSKSKLWKDLGKKIALAGGKSSIMKMISIVLEMIRYIYIANPLYGKTKDGNINNIIFAPDIFMKIPPRCNVLFPEDYESITPKGIVFDRIPTRLTSIIQNPYSGGNYANPKIKIFVEPKEHEDALKARNFSFISEEEFYRGPSRTTSMIYSNMYAQAGASSDAYTKEATAFDYYLQRYAHRSITITTRKFIPELIVGMPILICRYPKKHLLGRLLAYTLRLTTGKGTAEPQVAMAMEIDCVRRYNETEAPSFENWFQSDLYDNQYIGRSIYLDHLGFHPEDKDGSIMIYTKENRNDMKTAIESLCNGVDGIYDKQTDKNYFRKMFRNRRILTLKESMEFIGAIPKNINSKQELEPQYNNAKVFEHSCDYRSFSPEFKTTATGSQEGPYISQRQEQMLKYAISLADIMINVK